MKFNLKTPGRENSEIKLMSKKEYQATKNAETPASVNAPQESLEARIIAALGGADNIVTVTCCATRLRVTVKDEALVVSDDVWKDELEALGIVHVKNSLQIIYGVRVQNVTTAVKDILGID